MFRRTRTAALLLCLVLLLCTGCGAQPLSAGRPVPDPPGEKPAQNPRAEFINCGNEFDSVLIGLQREMTPETKAFPAFAYYDLDGDGANELLVGEGTYTEAPKNGAVIWKKYYSIYDFRPVEHVTEEGDGDPDLPLLRNVTICADGSIRREYNYNPDRFDPEIKYSVYAYGAFRTRDALYTPNDLTGDQYTHIHYAWAESERKELTREAYLQLRDALDRAAPPAEMEWKLLKPYEKAPDWDAMLAQLDPPPASQRAADLCFAQLLQRWYLEGGHDNLMYTVYDIDGDGLQDLLIGENRIGKEIPAKYFYENGDVYFTAYYTARNGKTAVEHPVEDYLPDDLPLWYTTIREDGVLQFEAGNRGDPCRCFVILKHGDAALYEQLLQPFEAGKYRQTQVEMRAWGKQYTGEDVPDYAGDLMFVREPKLVWHALSKFEGVLVH